MLTQESINNVKMCCNRV